ncbi:MAG: bifunctional diaminohydroxyphosphoribosylaminopyrimidine deaminase/5-amino-6-(5-phosphoribosylamino)uracil reductase RibD [Deltaproteobacteria bacterium]|nr:MAG: bifunctional diaminohydroxyphosphoribosylaminopyrimidine deaminase/5-amino-6-(5-phosphoribosylamino)uracil reductase RibD [Deltaproteobacteria bacterium]
MAAARCLPGEGPLRGRSGCGGRGGVSASLPAAAGASADDLDATMMRRCLELAARAAGRTAPNPMVGAVIVADGAVVAEGWHRASGQAHAEVDALSKVGGRAPGATMYVNLEPCCHHGRTPPCTDAILASGVRRVVVGMVDPDPRVSGAGIRILRRAGIEVVVGVEEAACRSLNLGFLRVQEAGRAAVVLKAAITLDGRIAAADGRSRWITGPQARRAGHALRDRCDAVMVGRGTLEADDPSLTTRGIDGGRDAVPVVLDSMLRCAPGARVLHAGRRPLIFAAEDAPERSDLPAEVVRVPRDDAGLDLGAVLRELASRGLQTVLVEGGARVHRSLLDAGLVDRVHLFVAPRVLAGGPGWVAGPPYGLETAPTLSLCEVRRHGDDLELVLESACSRES